jgi:hemolysin activation/secretion protein
MNWQSMGLPLCGLGLWAAPVLGLAAPSAADLWREAGAVPASTVQTTAESALPPLPASAADLALATGLKLQLKQLRWTGVSVVPLAELEALLADALGQELDFAQLQALAQRVTQFYRAKGYVLARAYLPVQQISEGVLQIQVLEGRLGQIRVQAQAPLDEAALAARLMHLRPGQVLRNEDLESDLLRLGDLPGLRVSSVLRPGAQTGWTDLEIHARLEPSKQISLGGDNYGSPYTGQGRVLARWHSQSPWQVGDNLDLSLTLAGATYVHGRAAYQMPVGVWGTQLGLAVSRMHYELDGEFASLNASGQALQTSLYAEQSLWRSRTFNLNAQLSLDQKRFDDQALGLLVTKRLNLLTGGLTVQLAHSRQIMSQVGLQLSQGRLHLDDSNLSADQQGLRTNGRFAHLNTQAELWFYWWPGTSSALKLKTQHSNRNLDASEKMGLGGLQGVRAFAASQSASDDALILTAECHQQLWDGVNGYVFWDGARGDAAHEPNTTNLTTSVNRQTLVGAGFGLDGHWPQGWSWQTAVAWRSVARPEISDGKPTPRAWVQVLRNF